MATQAGEQLVKDDEAHDRSLSISLENDREWVTSTLSQSIWQLARAARIIRTASTHRQTRRSKLNFTTALLRDAEMINRGRENCPEITEEIIASDFRPLESATHLSAGNCDLIRVSVKNTSPHQHFYVGGFYVDSRGGVSLLTDTEDDEEMPNCAYPLPPFSADELKFDVGIYTWYDGPSTVGLERIVFLAIRQDKTGLPPNLCSLAQETLSAQQQMRSGESDLDNLLSDIGGVQNRGGGSAHSSKRKSTRFVAMEAHMIELDIRP